jgi:hypothetical protein
MKNVDEYGKNTSRFKKSFTTTFSVPDYNKKGAVKRPAPIYVNRKVDVAQEILDSEI